MTLPTVSIERIPAVISLIFNLPDVFSKSFIPPGGGDSGGEGGSSRSATFESSIEEYSSTLNLGGSEFGNIDITNTALIPVEFNISTNSELIVFVDNSNTANISYLIDGTIEFEEIGDFSF